MRWDIINHYIRDRNFSHYLEIGIGQGVNWNRIECSTKVGVDPSEKAKEIVPDIEQMTSDHFFLANNDKFDIIFIDGLHHADQLLRDVRNSLRILNQNGVIICHDLLPDIEETQLVPRQSKRWTGDCWKAWAYLRSTDPNLKMFIYDIDHGVGVIERGQQNLIDCSNLDWDWFVKNRGQLNIRSYDPNVLQMCDFGT